jgi:hypothetical protein
MLPVLRLLLVLLVFLLLVFLLPVLLLLLPSSLCNPRGKDSWAR